MTDIVKVDESPGPKTHALIIGVGHYQHLRGGEQQVAGLETMGLGQLSSTVASARSIANWVVTDHRNADAPLGSAQLLLSPGELFSDGGINAQVETATMLNVQTAFDIWLARCSSDAGDVALFYFAGHGVMKETLALLVEDFGASIARPFQQSIDFNKTLDGMRQCQAHLQCYWVDSCRSVPTEVLKDIELEATALITPKVRGVYPRSAPVIHATSPTEAAYGRNDVPTQFATALARSLRATGSVKKGGQWLITPSHLFAGVAAETKRLAVAELLRPVGERLLEQVPTSSGDFTDDVAIAELRARPAVPVMVDWRPGAAATFSTATLSAVFDRSRVYQSSRTEGPWSCDVEAGTYVLDATFDPPWTLAPGLDQEFPALPPGYEATIEAAPK
jgi:hypothetical protein